MGNFISDLRKPRLSPDERAVYTVLAQKTHNHWRLQPEDAQKIDRILRESLAPALASDTSGEVALLRIGKRKNDSESAQRIRRTLEQELHCRTHIKDETLYMEIDAFVRSFV